MIQDVDGIPWERQTLRFDGEPLNDTRTLADYNVRDEAILELFLLDDNEDDDEDADDGDDYEDEDEIKDVPFYDDDVDYVNTRPSASADDTIIAEDDSHTSSRTADADDFGDSMSIELPERASMQSQDTPREVEAAERCVHVTAPEAPNTDVATLPQAAASTTLDAPDAPAPAKVTAKQVKVLRDVTGFGLMDCKRALVRFDCDYPRAAAWLRSGGNRKGGTTMAAIAETHWTSPSSSVDALDVLHNPAAADDTATTADDTAATADVTATAKEYTAAIADDTAVTSDGPAATGDVTAASAADESASAAAAAIAVDTAAAAAPIGDIAASDDTVAADDTAAAATNNTRRVVVAHKYWIGSRVHHTKVGIRVDLLATVHDVKAVICDRLEIDPEQNRFTHRGREMEENDDDGQPLTLADYCYSHRGPDDAAAVTAAAAREKSRCKIHVAEVVALAVCCTLKRGKETLCYGSCRFNVKLISSDTSADIKAKIEARFREERGCWPTGELRRLDIRNKSSAAGWEDGYDDGHVLITSSQRDERDVDQLRQAGWMKKDSIASARFELDVD